MASTTARYPFSSRNGEAIPLEVLKFYGTLTKTFTSGSASAAIAVPSSIEAIQFKADADCYLSFGGTAAVPADATLIQDLVLLPAGVERVIAPTADTFTVIGASGSGNLACGFLQVWNSLTAIGQVGKV